MKNILRHLWRDKVSLGIWGLTIGAAIGHVWPMLFILILFIFRGMMWEGQYVDALNKYVTDPGYRKILGLDGNHKTPVIEIIFEIILVLGIVSVAVYLALHGLN